MIEETINLLLKAELEHQDNKWGKDRILNHRLWIAIIGEEFGEVCHANLENDLENYADELIDLAASCISALKSYLLEKKENDTI